MSDEFRISRFVSSILLLIEELILLAGNWFYADYDVRIKYALTAFCIMTLVGNHFIKDNREKLYIVYDFYVVLIVSFILGIVYRNLYVTVVATLFYYVKSIYFRDKRIIVYKIIVDCVNVFGLYFVEWPMEIVTFDLFLTFFVCLALVMIGTLSIQVMTQINAMLDEAVEAEVSMDDLLRLVESKVIEAQEANQAKGQFLASMSHEIRTPINAVLGLDTMILRESKEENTLKYAHDIQSAGRNLLAVINDILDFTKFESGKMELVNANYDFTSVINDVVSMIQPRTDEKGLDFVLEIDESIPSRFYGDDVRIKQILVNLLTNAVKYTQRGNVALRIKAEYDGDFALLSFSVKDTGNGIRQEDIEKLSVAFVRIDELNIRNIEGTGLGLNIVNNFLQLMESKLELDSVVGEGSDFHFTIRQRIIDWEPIGDYEERIRNYAREKEYVVAFRIPDCKLLVVDDNAMNRNVFAGLLVDMECEIDEAESGSRALELASEKKYDIIFMDHMMPEMDGIETYRRMKAMANRRDYPNAKTPVVVLTANAISGARETYMAEGFNEYLSKPIDSDRLEALIGTLIPNKKKKPAKKKSAQAKETEVISAKDLPFVDGVDWQGALNKLKEMKLLMDSVKSFEAMADTDLAEVNALYDKVMAKKTEEHFSEFRIRVHSMKSSAATIGAFHVAGLAKYLEYAARDFDTDTIERLLPIFVREWSALTRALREAFPAEEEKNGQEEKQRELSGAELKSFLGILAQAMEELDMDRADAVMEELQEYEYPGEQKEILKRLKNYVINLDAESSLEAIKGWYVLLA